MEYGMVVTGVRGIRDQEGQRGTSEGVCSAFDSGVGSYSVCEECTNWIMFRSVFLRYVKLLRVFFFFGWGKKRISWAGVGGNKVRPEGEGLRFI